MPPDITYKLVQTLMLLGWLDIVFSVQRCLCYTRHPGRNLQPSDPIVVAFTLLHFSAAFCINNALELH